MNQPPTTNGSELQPQSLDHLTPGERMLLWVDVMNATHELLLAGLRREIGPDGDLQAAHRAWYAERMLKHDAKLRRMAERIYGPIDESSQGQPEVSND